MKNTGTDISADDYNAKFSVGQYVKFGIYRQTASPKSNEPIEWQVLDRDGDNALLLSRSCLDVQQYNDEGACTWETSWLRCWLNGGFLNTAFSAEEQTAILMKDVDNSAGQGNPEYSEEHVDGGNNTQDKVFLLSYAEANKYLEVGSKTNGEKAKTSLTEYALLAAGSDNEKSSTSAAPEQIQKPLELTYRRTADAAKKRLTKVMPDVSLYPHYDRIRAASRSAFPGVKIVVNAGGTEYRFVSLREVTEYDDMDDFDYGDAEEEAAEKERKAVYGRVVAKDTEKYDLDQKAKKMQSLFHVSESAFDPRHDRECELEEGYLHRAYMLSGLRSIAWTLADYCKQQNCTPDEIDSGEASRIADFVAGQNWLNYDGTTYCQGLCSGMDIHVFFIPDESDPADREKLLPSQEDFDRVKRMREVFTTYNEVLPEVHSLNALRKDLAYIYPAIQVMWDNLAKDRNYDEALLGNEADIVYAWCALALAAKEPFFSEDGPMTCYFSRILSEEEKRAKEEEKRAKYEERWLQEYGKYVETNPLIDTNGSLFVFTGLGHAGPKKENPVVQKLIEKGGQYRSSISGRTNYLVVNPREAGESKIEAVLEQREKGTDIKVIFLEDLKKALGMKEPEQDAVSDSETSPTNDSAKAMSIPNGKKTISEEALHGAYEAKAWWLRSPGETQARAMCVAIDGSISYDDEVVAVQGVRPALWVDLKSLQTGEKSGKNKEAAKTSTDTDIVGDAAKESKRKRAKAKKYSRKQVFGKYDGLGGDVVIPDGIKKIEDMAFGNCESLRSIVIPNGVECIGKGAFDECENLTSVSLPEGLEEIGDRAFSVCKNLRNIEIPNGVRIIGKGAFRRCENLTSIEIPSSVERIGEGAFRRCENLTSVSLPEGLEEIGDSAFSVCKNLCSIEIPSSVERIGKGAFDECENLTSVSLPEGLEEIGDRAFSECKSLTSIEIPSSVKRIGKGAFGLCKNLTSVSLPEGLEEIGDRAFSMCKNPCSIEIPSSVERIGEKAFEYCENLTSVTLSEGVKEIGDGMFWGCGNLKSVRIPASLTDIGEGAFYCCSSLETVIVYGDRYSSDTLNAMKKHFYKNVSVIWEGSEGRADAGKSPSAGDSAASDTRRSAANDEGCRILSYNDEIQFVIPEDMDDCQMIWSTDEDGSTECNIVMGEYTDDDGETAYHLNVSVAVVDGNIDEEKDWAFSDEEASGGLYNVTSQWRRYSDRIGMRMIEFEMLHGFSTFYMAMLYVQLDQKKQIRFTNENLGSDEDERRINAMFMRCITDALRYQGNALILPSIGDEAEPGRHLEKYNDEIYFDLTKDYQVTWGKSGGAPLFIITKGKCDEEKENNPFMAFIREEDISEEIEPGRSLLDIIHQRLPEYRQLSLSTEPEAVLGMAGSMMHKGEQIGIDWCLYIRVSDTQMVRLAICILKKGYEDAHEYIKELVKALRYKGNAIRTIELTDAELDKLEEPLALYDEEQSDSRYPIVSPSTELYSHYSYKKKRMGGQTNQRGVTVIFRTVGREFQGLDILEMLGSNDHEDTNIYQKLKAIMSEDKYDLDQIALKMAQVFRVEKSVFDDAHDDEGDIRERLMDQKWKLSALRSFAWTLAALADREGKSIDEYDYDELTALCSFIEKREWLNYTRNSWFDGFCGQDDIHSFYVPDKLIRTGESDEIWRLLLKYPCESLDSFRNDLAKLKNVMIRLHNGLLKTRNRQEKLDTPAAAVLQAWCTMAVSAKVAFLSEECFEVCIHSYPEDPLNTNALPLDERVAPEKTTPPEPEKATPTPAKTTQPEPMKAAAPSGSTASAEPRPAAEPEAAAATAAPTRRRRSQAQRLAELEKQEEAAEQAKRLSAEEKPAQEAPIVSMEMMDPVPPVVSGKPFVTEEQDGLEKQAERLSTEEKPTQEAPSVFVKMMDPVPPVVSGKPFMTEEQDDPEGQERKWKKIRRRRSAGKFLIAVGICMILLFGVGIVKGRADVNHIWAMIAGALEIGLGATWTKQE